MSLKNLILAELKIQYPKAVHKGELGRKAVNEWNYENENMGRRCRELADEGKIERIIIKGEAWYRAKAPDYRINGIEPYKTGKLKKPETAKLL